jgi:alkylation response protein AidB-like acyl-CoA dehydrogenase
MDLVLTEEQELLQQTAREFVTKNSSLRRIRALRDSQEPLGYSPDLYDEMAKLGWLGIVFPEEYGGSGLGYTELMVVLEELGRGLMPEPVLSTVLLGGATIARGGSQAQRQKLLPALINGELRVTLAHQEPRSRYNPLHVETRAERADAGWLITGTKVQVLDGAGADRLIVPARTGGAVADRTGITLFLIDTKTPGLAIERQRRIDGRNTALVRFENVRAEADDLLASVDAGGDLLSAVIDQATVGLCAEMLGSMTAALEMTLAYLKTRTQFGVPIGSFQALKHRAAKMYIETELARSAVVAAHKALDENGADVPRLSSLAKARCSDAFVLIGNESVQMHGGIGMTDEHDIGFFIKRARTAEITFGDAAYHRNRFAELLGY